MLIAKLVRAVFGNVLGEVTEKEISFDSAGNSGLELFTLKYHKLATTPVSIHFTTWNWQAYEGGAWIDIGSTQHKIFVVLQLPKTPWQQGGISANNQQLPWVDALDKACTWALGANTLDEAAEKITKAINTRPNASYTPSTIFGSTNYNLTGYLSALDASANFVMNCRDSANAVATFSNLLGTNLYVGKFDTLFTRPFLTLSGNPGVAADWVTWNWAWHEIVWVQSTMSSDGLIYDGCLRVDVDDNYSDNVHVAQHPIKMKFGTINDGSGYRYRLIDTGSGTPSPPTKQRPLI